MVEGKQIPLDIAVVGGGPAGIFACVELLKSSRLAVALFEAESELGGLPRTSDLFCFGLRDMKRIYRGSAYAHRLNNLIRNTSARVYTNSTVINLVPGKPGGFHRLDVATPQGLLSCESKYVILATGCYETSRAARIIPGDRPAGVLTTATLMELVNLRHLKPGTEALIIGSEHVSLSSVVTLRKAGISIVGMVEEDPCLQTYPFFSRAMKALYKFPIYKNTVVNAILGDKRVQEIELLSKGEPRLFRVKCDTVLLTGKFRSYSPLIDNTPIQRDPLTFGPIVDLDLMTSVENIFSAGNVLRGAQMHDLCALEGKKVAYTILRRLESRESGNRHESVFIRSEFPIRYVVPQKINRIQGQASIAGRLSPGVSVQVAHTLRRPVLEAWSGEELVWKKSFSRLIANTRIGVPIHAFDWDRVDEERGVTLKIKGRGTRLEPKENGGANALYSA